MLKMLQVFACLVVALATPALALKHGTFTAVVTTATDNFNRANGSLGSNWVSSPSFTGLAIVSNAANSGSAAWRMAYWNPATNTFSNDQYSEVTVGGTFAAAVVRHQVGVSSMYIAIAEAADLAIYRIDSGTFNLLVAPAATIVPGDVIKLRVTGSALVASLNGVDTASVTDATYSSGSPGIAAFNTSVDNWTGFPITAAATIEAPGPSAALFAAPYYTCTRNFYVAPTGTPGASDSNNTTQAQSPSTAWVTIGRYNALIGGGNAGGDCINVAPGTYANGLEMTKGGTTATNTGYVTYRCTTLNGCTVTDTGTNGGSFATNAAFAVSANYIIIDGFTINGGAGTTNGRVGIKSCQSNTCGSLPSGTLPTTTPFHHIWVINNIISGYGQAGVELDNGEFFYVVHNTIFNNSHDCDLGVQGSNISYFLPTQIPSYTPTADDGNNLVTGNTGTNFRQFMMWNVLYNSYVCLGSTLNVTDGNGIILDDWLGDQFGQGATGTHPYINGGLIAFNVVYNNGSYGIHPFNSQYAVVANNSVFNNNLQTGNTNQGFRAGIDDNKSYAINIINNISYTGCGTGALANNNAMGLYSNQTPSSTTLSAAITTTGQTSISITSAAQFPGGSTFNSNGFASNGSFIFPGGNMIKIDNEVMQVTAGWTTTTLTVTRGLLGTTAATHSNGATINWIQSYWSNNITRTTAPCGEIDIGQGGNPNGSFYSGLTLGNANLLATLPGWVDVGNTSFGAINTQPNGVNFALSGGSASIGYGTRASPFTFLSAQAVDAGACYHTLSTCP